MKSESAIRQKFKQARYRHQAKFLHKNLKEVASNCKSNRTFKDTAICIHPEVSDRECTDKSGRAKGCPHFCHYRSKGDLKASFERAMALAKTPVALAEAGYHDLAALAWVLDDEAPEETSDEDEADMEKALAVVTADLQAQAGAKSPEPWYLRWLWWRRP